MQQGATNGDKATKRKTATRNKGDHVTTQQLKTNYGSTSTYTLLNIFAPSVLGLTISFSFVAAVQTCKR